MNEFQPIRIEGDIVSTGHCRSNDWQSEALACPRAELFQYVVRSGETALAAFSQTLLQLVTQFTVTTRQ